MVNNSFSKADTGVREPAIAALSWLPRFLIGYQGELLTDTRGTAIMNRLFKAYEPYKPYVFRPSIFLHILCHSNIHYIL